MKTSEIKFFGIFWTILTVIYFAGRSAFAQAVDATTPQLPVALQNAQLIVNQLGTPWIVSGGVIALEILLRSLKTQNPQSLLYLISNIFKMIAKVLEFLASLADQVLQRTKDQTPDPLAQPQNPPASKAG